MWSHVAQDEKLIIYRDTYDSLKEPFYLLNYK